MKRIYFLFVFLLPVLLVAQNIERKPGNNVVAAQLWYANILDYGAKTTSADNSAALVAAAGAGNKVIFIPPGVFISSSITLPAGTTVIGVDTVVSVLKWKSGASNGTHQFTVGSNTTFTNVRIDGNSANAAVTTSHCIYASSVNNINLDKVYILNGPEQGLELDNVTNFSVYRSKLDSNGRHAIQCYNARNGVIRDTYISGWDLENFHQCGIAITGDSSLTLMSRSILIDNLTSVNKYSDNFSVETPGAKVQIKDVTISNSHFYTHTSVAGGAGVSMSWDSSMIFHCYGESDTTGYGIECSGSGNTYLKNTFKNLKIVFGTYLKDTARNNTCEENTVRMTDPRQQDAAIQLGGHTSAGLLLNGVFLDNKIKNNYIDSREGNLQVGILLGNTNSGKGVLLSNEISGNKSYGTGYLMAFDGVRGNNNKVFDNTAFGANTVALYFGGGPYNFTQFERNTAPGGTIFGSGVNSTNFPNFTDFHNVTDTTAVQATGTSNVIVKQTSPVLLGGPTTPVVSRLDNSTLIANTAYVDREAGFQSLLISSAGTGTTFTRARYTYVYLDPPSSLGASAVGFSMPTSPLSGDILILVAGRQIAVGGTVSTNFSITSSGSLIYGTVPTTLVGGDCLMFLWQPLASQWLRIKF